jgi:alkaline phosphatase
MKKSSYLLPALLLIIWASVPGKSVIPAEQITNRDGLKHDPKNIIIMIADGCGYSHIDAATIYQYGRTGIQLYEHFPVQLAMSTYMYSSSYDPAHAWTDFEYVKANPTDSAAAATAMSTGQKTYGQAIGVNSDGMQLKNIMQQAEELGKATGVITSVEWSHATPAGFVAHNLSRNNYAAIAREMVYESATDVIMGCGHPWFDKNGTLKSSPNTFRYVGDQPTWDDLVAGTAASDADGDGDDDPWTLIQTRDEFQALMTGSTPDRLMGVAPVYTTLQQERGGDAYADPYAVPLIQTVPTFEEMTRAALNIVDNDPDGFVLMVEGGAVDWAAHANQSGRVIEEEIAFNHAVEAAVDWVEKNSNWGETLLIVTGDHETGYLTGPGSDPAWMPLVNNGAGNLPGMEWHSGDHTNSLIPFFAKGRGATLFRKDPGVLSDPVRGDYIDNTMIANVLFGLLK